MILIVVSVGVISVITSGVVSRYYRFFKRNYCHEVLTIFIIIIITMTTTIN